MAVSPEPEPEPEPEPTTMSDGMPRKKQRGKQMHRIEESWLKRPYAEAGAFGKAVLEGCFTKGISLLALRTFVCRSERRTIGEELFRRVLQGKSKALRIKTVYDMAIHLGLEPVGLAMLYDTNLEQANVKGYEFEFLWNRVTDLDIHDQRRLHGIITALLDEEHRIAPVPQRAAV